MNRSLSLLIFLTLCSAPLARATQPAAPPASHVTKPVSFAILEDYDKGDNLNDVALDFQLLNQLGINQMRCSFGWDDYEPQRGKYDFVWLKQFVALAAQYGIQLRPYLAYTAPWAGVHGSDGLYWNDPPADLKDWYNFVYQLAAALRPYANVLSYEIYNEENDSFWWEGGIFKYGNTLQQAALAVRAADPDAEVIVGGFVFPDFDWLFPLVDAGLDQYYDILPFHAYPETWEDSEVEDYLDVQYYDYFVPENKEGGNKPIWVNETGFATTKGKTEQEQANWFLRATSTFLADGNIQELGYYEIKDLSPDDPALGGEPNYHLGLTYVDRTKKLAFSTVQMISSLLNVGTLTVADADAGVTVTGGRAGELYSHLFKRPDGSQILFVYDKTSTPTVQVQLKTKGSKAYRYNLDGTFALYPAFDGKKLSDVALTPGNVGVFRIDR
ncbi:MAG TPA: cellulase family glycosylhydrolase [Chthoniobacterales bacterium]|jgi:hypothetical protein|nr:cellulase family glycosylhydrolase [Chthoniobacterales bacterium]